MGLDTSHGAWHGPYSAFMEWRRTIAKLAGFPLLDSMEGFGGETSWEPFESDALTALLHHSDCEGELDWQLCTGIADRLEQLLPNIRAGWMYSKTESFIAGCRDAAAKRESILFH